MEIVYSRSESSAKKVAERHGIAHWTHDMKKAINHPGIDTVLVTKPLGRNSAEAKEMLEIVEKHGVFHGYLEDPGWDSQTDPEGKIFGKDHPKSLVRRSFGIS